MGFTSRTQLACSRAGVDPRWRVTSLRCHVDDVVADWLAEGSKTINSVLVINRDEYLKQGCAMMESVATRPQTLKQD